MGKPGRAQEGEREKARPDGKRKRRGGIGPAPKEGEGRPGLTQQGGGEGRPNRERGEDQVLPTREEPDVLTCFK